MTEQYLYQKLDTLTEAGFLKELPDYLEQNLSTRISLRDYQINSFRCFITYAESKELRKNKQLHTLFHMATGSGKTVIMAGLIFYLYAQGCRNFLFFVNQTNILEKTKENFLNPSSGKYLFAERAEIFGDQIAINEVSNFSFSNPQAINLCFTTTQQLHYDLNFSKENSLTYEDFTENKVVLISDESHHINTRTKRRTQAEAAEDSSWEYSVERIFRANGDNVLLEFTATCDLKDPAVKRKYLDKIVFDYPLSKFRASGFTKDFQNMQTEHNLWDRTLLALVLSEYRKGLFAEAGQNIKPVVLLKSQRIVDSADFYDEFFIRLTALTPKQIESLQTVENDLTSVALNYFRQKDPSLHALVNSLQISFAENNAIIMNGSTDNTQEKQLAVNSLEEPNNPYRIIFTVDMLNEGWDVLNLFDIVRLYETRQGSGKAGKIGAYTIKEAQLIGRGARYCPFLAEPDQERFKRKYDYDLDNANRVLETLLYHSKQDSRYITELRQALKATGLLPDNPVEIEYRLKNEFLGTTFYQEGIVFSNRKLIKSRQSVAQMENKIRNSFHRVTLGSSASNLYSLFDDTVYRSARKTYSTQLKLKELPLNILYGAAESFDVLKFNVLQSHYPQLSSTKEFLTSPNYAGNVTLEIKSPHEKLSGRELLQAAKAAFQEIAQHVGAIKREYEGSKEFYSKPVPKVLRDKKIYLDNPHGEGAGISQSKVGENLAVYLLDEDWYVYEDNYGTTEEKAFVKYFSSKVPELRKKYQEIYLVRNERIADLAIYDFGTGERFEPDFILFLRKYHAEGYEQEQIYIEPKGTHLLEKDAWKEEFLKRIEAEGVPVKYYADDHQYKIVGLPFFNVDHWDEFEQALEEQLRIETE